MTYLSCPHCGEELFEVTISRTIVAEEQIRVFWDEDTGNFIEEENPNNIEGDIRNYYRVPETPITNEHIACEYCGQIIEWTIDKLTVITPDNLAVLSVL